LEGIHANEDKMVVKCVVWDLDNTLWDGVLLEDGNVAVKRAVVDVIRTLDERGILQSIASRNDLEPAMTKLREFGLEEYFLYPQIHWNPKSTSVRAIGEALNIGLDTIAFVDDEPFERDEVQFALPSVRCIDAGDAPKIPLLPEMSPRFLTEDSRMRRRMYLSDITRKEVEAVHSGSPEEFLASLQMSFTLAPARQEDLQRAEELTVRTNQLNATGYTYSYDELNRFRTSPDHELLIAGLDDKYGTYGKIGLSLVERSAEVWTLKLLLMSCRVVSRGVGTVLLNHIIRRAHDAGVKLRAEFAATDRNRMMYVTYKFAGFREIDKKDGVTILENDYSRIQTDPSYLELLVRC
jgi:FkbH-like protein